MFHMTTTKYWLWFSMQTAIQLVCLWHIIPCIFIGILCPATLNIMSATYFSSIVHLVSIMFESNLFKYLTTSNIVIGGGLKSRSIFFILMTSNIRKLQKLKTTLSDLLYRVFFYVFVDLSRASLLLMRQRIPRSKQCC